MSLTQMVIMPGNDYQDICDAVREKTNTGGPLTSGKLGGLIRGISTSASASSLDGVIARTAREFRSDTVSVIGDKAFYEYHLLSTVSCANATEIKASAFEGCASLVVVSFPKVTTIGGYAFSGCSDLETAVFPKLTTLSSSGCFQYCSRLKRIDFPMLTNIPSLTFSGCDELDTLILRSEVMCPISSTNSLGNGPISEGTGYVYVPAALMDAYKAHTKWSSFANQLRAIEDYPDICASEGV